MEELPDMGYGIEATTADCYPGTSCLINKLGIQDETKLAETEAAVVLGKASFLDQQPVTGEFDFTHYRSIHHFLFCDLYDWAGQILATGVWDVEATKDFADITIAFATTFEINGNQRHAGFDRDNATFLSLGAPNRAYALRKYQELILKQK